MPVSPLGPLPAKLSIVPPEKLPPYRSPTGNPPFVCWVSKQFFVQLYREAGGVVRITVNRVKRKASGKWREGIVWDELQKIKREVGYGDRFAVECFPEDDRVIRDANMRHLWVLPYRPAFAW